MESTHKANACPRQRTQRISRPETSTRQSNAPPDHQLLLVGRADEWCGGGGVHWHYAVHRVPVLRPADDAQCEGVTY